MILFFYYILLILSLFGLSWIPDSVATFLVLCFIDFLIGKAIWQDYEPFKPYKYPIREFLSEQWDKWNSHSGLKKTYFVLGFIASVILLILLVFIAIKFVETIGAKKTRFRDVALALFATLSGFGVLFGFYTSIVRTETAEQGQITDRLNKAIENLGKSENGIPVIEVRIGALYALERIAKDSFRDHIQIMEIFCTYIRHNSPLIGSVSETHERISEDVQTALTIIARREEWPEGAKRIKKEKQRDYRISLYGCNLQEAHLGGANLNNAWISKSNLANAYLNKADLSNAEINRANLNGACLNIAKLVNTSINDTTTERAYANRGDFSKCKNLIQDQLDVMYCGIRVGIPNGLTRPKHWSVNSQSTDDFMDSYIKWGKAQIRAKANKASPKAKLTPNPKTTNN